jgi:hypothetical protein
MTTSSEGYGKQFAAIQPEFVSWPFPSVAAVQGTKLQQLVSWDAVLYLGPESRMTISPITLSLCDDDTYFEMRRRRMAATWSPGVVEDIQRECAALKRR